jgi:cbb3-type cytochrome oxidase maturation protein
MIAIYLMLPVSLLLALIFLLAYVWSVRTGQYDDTHTPSLRILSDDAGEARDSSATSRNARSPIS